MNLRNTLDLIPAGAKITAAFAFSLTAVLVYRCLDGVVAAALGAAVGGFLAAYILLIGYVYADASRRGMPPIPWAALAALVPNCIGFVLYFLLRKPVVHPCPRCGASVPADAAFCPKCGQPQGETA